MIVNCKIEITDEWRQLLASQIAGKTVRRMATRNDVRQFVEGCIAAACEDNSYECEQPVTDRPQFVPVMNASNLTDDESQVVSRLRSEGKDESYITGWLIFGRGTGAARPRL